MKSIKYPLTVYSVCDDYSYGSNKKGHLERVIIDKLDPKKDPDTTHHIESGKFIIRTDCMDHWIESKFFISLKEARRYADELTNDALKEARETLKFLINQKKSNAKVK